MCIVLKQKLSYRLLMHPMLICVWETGSIPYFSIFLTIDVNNPVMVCVI